MLIYLLFFFLPCLAQPPDESSVPQFAFSWLDGKDKYQTGETAVIMIKVIGDFQTNGNASLQRSAFHPTIEVNGKIGNSSYISGVYVDLTGDYSNWKIVFIPIAIGVFNAIIDEQAFKVMDSSLHFNVEPGVLYPSICVASWMGLISEHEAGEKATVLVLPRDAFGNNISSPIQELASYNFSVTALYENGSFANAPNVTHVGWNEFGYVILEFLLVRAGDFLLLVQGGSQTLNGSPLPLKVNPGPFNVSNSVAKWKFETNEWQLLSTMEILIYQLDDYGNLIPMFYDYDAEVVEQETHLSIPIADLLFQDKEPGVQLLSFSMSEPGNFLLTISDLKHNRTIANMPYAYTVYVGYCDGSMSIVNGSGLNSSVVGEVVHLSVYLNDAFQYPSEIDVKKLQVQIIREIDSSFVFPTIHPRTIVSGAGFDGKPHNDATGQISPVLALSNELSDSSSMMPNELVSIFDIFYTPEKIGIYKIHIYSGNIGLNGGHPFRKEVAAGEVNVSVSKFVDLTTEVRRKIKNHIVVQLVDSFMNPVLLQQSKLKLEIVSANTSGFSSWEFEGNSDGTYTVGYLAMDLGTYQICVSFDSQNLSPCPIGVNVYKSDYFPKAYDDTISVLEDESVAFDPLANDYFTDGNASIAEFSKPGHGSLIQNGRFFRYTPLKDISGNDSFTYTISDVNGNLATASVNISILTCPPQFVSFPRKLQATEDLVSPRFGGFSGLEITYSDQMERISVTLSAVSGMVFLSPMLMQFWEPAPAWRRLAVSQQAKNLILEGSVEEINFALQSIRYLGNENFSGVDTLRVYTKNKNGINKLDIPIFVEPMNDPPSIYVPEFIIVKGNGDESLIFDKEKDKFEFSVGDPDLVNFPGGESYFVVTFSAEVSDGSLTTSLPAELINSTELKLKSTYQWQPLETYITISEHFMVKAAGIRVQGTIKDCNSIMQKLIYNGGEHGATLKIKLSDMGHYGCTTDCTESISVPLHAEATVNLVRKKPMGSLAAHTLGSAIVLESLVVISFWVLLLSFTCKCAILLVNERRKCRAKNFDIDALKSFSGRSPSAKFSGTPQPPEGV